MFNKTTKNSGFPESTIEKVWRKATIVSGFNPDEKRLDKCGTLIIREEYGNTKSSFGWEIDYIIPVSKGGTDDLSNLQPLQWENNRHKADNYPHWTCKVKAA